MQSQSNIVTAVFEDFIARLTADTTFDIKARERLKNVLLAENRTDQEALNDALFAEDEVI